MYSYAGGPGLWTGNPEDVGRLFVAGTYQQAMQDRQAGRLGSAAGLFETLAARFPDDAELQLLEVDSLIQDRQDPQAFRPASCRVSRAEALAVRGESALLAKWGQTPFSRRVQPHENGV